MTEPRATPGESLPAVGTHGRHCPCSACRREDWTRPDLGPCGIHGPDCPNEYAPPRCALEGCPGLDIQEGRCPLGYGATCEALDA